MKTIGMCVLTAALALGGGAAFAADGHGRAPHKKGVCTGMWLEHMEGASASVTNLKDGVEVLIVSTDPVVAAKLQSEAPAYYAKKKDTACGCCAAALTGARTVVENTDNGVRIAITAADPGLVKKIQDRSGTMTRPLKVKKGGPAGAVKKSARWVCPMGEYESDKPGKCPKCGMNLVEKK